MPSTHKVCTCLHHSNDARACTTQAVHPPFTGWVLSTRRAFGLIIIIGPRKARLEYYYVKTSGCKIYHIVALSEHIEISQNFWLKKVNHPVEEDGSSG